MRERRLDALDQLLLGLRGHCVGEAEVKERNKLCPFNTDTYVVIELNKLKKSVLKLLRPNNNKNSDNPKMNQNQNDKRSHRASK